MNKGLYIEENKNNQRILLIDDNFQMSENISITYDQFDGMMFLSENGDLVERQFLNLNPLTESISYLKPFFCNPKIADSFLLKYAADGQTSNIDDSIVITKIDDVKDRIKELNIEIKHDEEIKGEREILISIFRFFLSRGAIPDAVLQEGSILGYCVYIYEFCMRKNLFSLQTVLLIYREYFKNRYLQHTNIIDVTQYCKYCNHTHIIYTEICPKCGSCDIELNNMMHHYPCANISEETSYMVKGDLICPKCQKHLHHIGVDYDRPAGIYNCGNCNASFSRSDMRGTCVSCRKILSLEELRVYKIYALKFSALGKEKVARWKIYQSDEDISVSAGLLSINSFIQYLSNDIEIYNLSNTNKGLTTIRVQGVPTTIVRELSKFIFDNIANAHCTFKNNFIYILLSYTNEESINSYAKLLDEYVKAMDIEGYIGVDYSNYVTTITTDDYLKKIF